MSKREFPSKSGLTSKTARYDNNDGITTSSTQEVALEQNIKDALSTENLNSEELSELLDQHLHVSKRPFLCWFLEHDYSHLSIGPSYLRGHDKEVTERVQELLQENHQLEAFLGCVKITSRSALVGVSDCKTTGGRGSIAGKMNDRHFHLLILEILFH